MTEQRKPVDEEIISRCETFTHTLLEQFPELDGLAVVVSFAKMNESLPFAVLRGQHGAIQTPVELVHMMGQTAKLMQSLAAGASTLTRAMDEALAERMKKLESVRTASE